jgi:hypothetical protein
MKLKLMIMCALFAAGAFASFALAEGGKHAKKAGDTCKEVHISGTIAPQTLAVTVDKANEKSSIPAGTQLSLAVGAAGQTVRVNVQACATGTGTTLQYSVRQIELRVKTTQTGTTQTGTTAKKHEDEHGDHHGHGTTTASTTTAATTTAATTTTAPTTTH